MGSMGSIERHRFFFIKIDARSIADGKIDETIDVILYLIERYGLSAIRSLCSLLSNKDL